MIDLIITPEFQNACRLGLVEIGDINIEPSGKKLSDQIEEFRRRRMKFFGEKKVADVPGVVDARTMFRKLGVDPNKVRPCSEVFLRHLLRGEPPPKVSNLVDLCNYCSAEAATPVCAYDIENVSLPIALRPGRQDENFEAIRRGIIEVEGRPILADADGPFGGPFVDSARTMITEKTRQALLVWYAPVNYDGGALMADLRTLAGRLELHSIGQANAFRCIPE